MKPKAIYKTALTHRIEKLLKNDGVIRKTRLQRGLALAYAGDEEGGLLTISRPATSTGSGQTSDKPPSDKEIKIVVRDFKVAATAVFQPVLKFRELSRETVQQGQGQHHVIRLSVAFGQQGRLF